MVSKAQELEENGWEATIRVIRKGKKQVTSRNRGG